VAGLTIGLSTVMEKLVEIMRSRWLNEAGQGVRHDHEWALVLTETGSVVVAAWGPRHRGLF